VLEVVAAERGVDTIIATQAMYHVLAGMLGPSPRQTPAFLRGLVDAPGKVRDKDGKPVVIVLPIGGDEVDKIEAEKGRREIRDTYLSTGIPSYPSLERAVRAVAHVAGYYRKLAELR
jgi:acyl-CoA synthetase (NDP forming)